MPTLPFSIYERPFAVEPMTKIMIPDGIFDTSLGEQLVGVYYTAESFDPLAWGISYALSGIEFKFEVSPTSGIFISYAEDGSWIQSHYFPMKEFRPGRQVLLFFKADFSQALPGKHRIRFRASVDYHEMPDWDIYCEVFVTKTTVNRKNRTIDVTCPEGTISLHFDSMYVFPYSHVGHDRAKWRELCVKRVYDPIEQRFTDRRVVVHQPLLLPKELTATCIFSKPFHGAHGELP